MMLKKVDYQQMNHHQRGHPVTRMSLDHQMLNHQLVVSVPNDDCLFFLHPKKNEYFWLLEWTLSISLPVILIVCLFDPRNRSLISFSFIHFFTDNTTYFLLSLSSTYQTCILRLITAYIIHLFNNSSPPYFFYYSYFNYMDHSIKKMQ